MLQLIVAVLAPFYLASLPFRFAWFVVVAWRAAGVAVRTCERNKMRGVWVWRSYHFWHIVSEGVPVWRRC